MKHPLTREDKAVEIAADAGQWLKCRTPAGRKLYGVPSQRTANRYYLTTRESCTCYDAARSPLLPCKHQMAVKLHCDRVGKAAA